MNRITFVALLSGLGWGTAGACGQCEVAQLYGTQSDQKKFNDLFGGSVALCGDVAVIVEPGFNGSEGALFILRYDGTTWTQEALLQAPEPSSGDAFGVVAMHGDVVLLGAPGTSTIAPNQGAVHVYRHKDRQWCYETSLTPGSTEKGLFFGYSVSIDGSVALIGSVAEEAAYVFRYDGRRWVQEQILTNPNAKPQDTFGVSVAIRGNIALVGDSSNADQGLQAGAAFVFRYEGTKWNLEAQLFASDAYLADWFGYRVATDGRIAVASAPRNQTGAAYVFLYDGAKWIEQQQLVPANPGGPYPLFGFRIALTEDGSTILAGATDDQDMGFSAGAVHIFRFGSGMWSEVIKITALDGQPGAQFGGALATDGDRALISASTQGDGKVYVYRGILGIDCNGNDEPDACDIFEGTSEDLDGDETPDECEVLGDVNGDLQVNIEDFIAVILAWGACPAAKQGCPADLDANGVVGFADLLVVILNWG